MAKMLMQIEGTDGQIDLTEDRVVIHRRGILNFFKYGLNKQREIPIHAISEVAFKNATALSMGSIEFVRSGRSTDEKNKVNLNAVSFGRKKGKEFEQLKEKVFDLMAQANKRAS